MGRGGTTEQAHSRLQVRGNARPILLRSLEVSVDGVSKRA